MEEKQMLEDVQFIKQMLKNNQRKLVDNGLSYIINGTGIAIGVPISIVMGLKGVPQYIPYFWMFMMVLMIGANIIMGNKYDRKQKVKSFGSELFKAAWGSCGIVILIITLLFMTTNHISATGFYTSISGILGIGYMLTGIINDLKFMKVLAIIWWVSAVIAGLWLFFGSIEYLGMFFSAVVLTQQAIPGIIIYKKWKRAYNE